MRSAGVDPGSCMAHGGGLRYASVGDAAEFSVETFTSFGQSIGLPKHGSEIAVEFVLGETKLSSVQAAISEVSAGRYSVAYTASTAGQYKLGVLINKTHISESPFDLCVDVGEPYGPKCRASGRGLQAARQGEIAQFKVDTYDRFGNKVLRGGARVAVEASSATEQTSGQVTDNGDGSYDCQYLPSDGGTYNVSVIVNGAGVAGSPFSVRVAAAEVDPPSCTASGDGLHRSLRLYSHGLYSYGLYSYGLDSYGLYSYGLYRHGLYSYAVYSYGLCSCGLYRHSLHSYGRCTGPCGLRL